MLLLVLLFLPGERLEIAAAETALTQNSECTPAGAEIADNAIDEDCDGWLGTSQDYDIRAVHPRVLLTPEMLQTTIDRMAGPQAREPYSRWYGIIKTEEDTNQDVDLQNGVWADGSYTGQQVKLIFMPTLNNHGVLDHEDYGGRTTSAADKTKTVGLCPDPITLDYWMCKYVMLPCRPSQTFMNPDLDNNFRQTLLGCNSMGVGTLRESRMEVHQRDLA